MTADEKVSPTQGDSKKRRPLVLSKPRKSTAVVGKTRIRRGGKRKVRSCSACRAAHLRCVAECYGVPCERCAKKGWQDCSLMEIPVDLKVNSEAQSKIRSHMTPNQKLQQLAIEVEKYMETEQHRGSSD
ncbi:hypothetical protein F5X96DRAFT_622188 [Biscogniauxia mediterranea]|nr:hypothetical protein F5X96DRAFT_622188 [Biscogniauxia mediterranea]